MDTVEQVVDIKTADGPMATPTSRPTDGGTHPGVIVIMEAFGVNPNIEGIVQRFASEGYVAAAPDLFHRSGRLRYAPYDKLQEMREDLRSGGFSDASIDMDVQAAIDYLRSDPNVGAIGIVGFCLGGRVSMQSAIRASGLSAAAVYYGGGFFPRGDHPHTLHPPPGAEGASTPALREAEALSIPVMGFFGEDDQNPSPEQVKELDERLTALGKEHAFHSYAGAGHGFVCDDRASHNAEAAADSWAKTLAFFGERLR